MTDMAVHSRTEGLSEAEITWTSTRGWASAQQGWSPGRERLALGAAVLAALALPGAFIAAGAGAAPTVAAGVALMGLVLAGLVWWSRATARVTLARGQLTAGPLQIPLSRIRDVRAIAEDAGDWWVELTTPDGPHRLYVGRHRRAEAEDIAARVRPFLGEADDAPAAVPDPIRRLHEAAVERR